MEINTQLTRVKETPSAETENLQRGTTNPLLNLKVNFLVFRMIEILKSTKGKQLLVIVHLTLHHK